MTAGTIDFRQMDAGPEMDELVAERVMGSPRPGPGFVRWAPVPRYSTDIAAAWQVVERLRGQHWWPAVLTQNNVAFPWSCEAIPPLDNSPGGMVWGYGTTAPQAICRCALAVAEFRAKNTARDGLCPALCAAGRCIHDEGHGGPHLHVTPFAREYTWPNVGPEASDLPND